MMTASLDFWHEYVSEPHSYCMTVCQPLQLILNMNNLKNWQKCHYYGILRHFTALRAQFFTESAL